jgi:farnesyl-diphosphate farnesyltransferase
LQSAILPHQVDEVEWQLMRYVPDCFRFFLQLSGIDQQYIRELVLTLTQGMQMDLSRFPGETAVMVRALPDLAALDQYTYFVAGVVGEFWTKIHAAHLPALRHCKVQTLCQLGVSFGKGLQMTNILRDIAKDFQRGRCYLPEKALAQYHIEVVEIGDPETFVRVRPLLVQLAWQTLEYFDQAQEYITRLPLRTIRLRLSCMLPLLFAVQTVDMVCKAEDLLCLETRVKISRQAVYRTILWSVGCLVIPGLFARYYHHLRQRLTVTLGLAASLS